MCSLNPVVSSHRLTTTAPVFAAGRRDAPHQKSPHRTASVFFRGFNIPRAVRTMSLMMSILFLWIVWHVFSNPIASMGRLYIYLHLPSKFIYHKHKRFMWVNIPFVPWMIWLFSKDLFKKTFYYMGLTTVWGRYMKYMHAQVFTPTIAADNGQLRPSQLKKTLFWTNSINNHMGIYKKTVLSITSSGEIGFWEHDINPSLVWIYLD